jgi:hypothetical protein
LHIKLARLTKALKKLNKDKIAENKRAKEEAQQAVLQLDQAQDERQLIEEEIQTRKAVKNRILALAAVQKIRLIEISLNLNQGERCEQQTVPPQGQC